ncbi:glucan endo-1 3-beta-glucosidase 3 [Phtheirospermum japonicum]|uniref:Glucan endo-1 3-beta-glucosidase 3 n=1 Tax=Phtheirospermum japonicum TaxID=374723 RepID=A0A830BWB9_9LAMI|nr:glucan endo-1 3-beta-glucosidase 3 [Phtheirospermum japonicum]
MVIPGRRLSSIALPPLVGTISPAPDSLPPCEPSRGPRQHHGLWCVAKPSVPAETLQEALDFACGEGGADCEAIGQDGSCYYPDTVVAHASYAFNSYWQRNKKSGGTCGFGGTAMLINSDPSNYFFFFFFAFFIFNWLLLVFHSFLFFLVFFFFFFF